MPKNPEKKAGNKGPCFRCGNTITCGTVEYSGEVKLQWQNDDGKAHYDKEGNCKQWVTSSENIVGTPQSGTIQDTIKLPESLPEIEQKLTNTMKEKSKALAFHKIAILDGVTEACKESGITHPATVGMLFNAINGELNES